MDDFFDIEPARPSRPKQTGMEVARAELERILNTEQVEAVVHTHGPLLVLAGAGSGKTRVITHKIAYLVEACGLQPWQILAVTFTNKAAHEMRERTEKLLGPAAKDVWVGTFHSTGLKLLRRHADLVGRTRDFVVYDQDDRERLIGQVLKDMKVDKDFVAPKKVGYYIEEQAHLLRGPGHAELPVRDPIEKICARAYEGYEKAKTRANAFDFGDLITKTVSLFKDHPPVLSEWQYKWRYIMVDEFQDTDRAQSELLRLLAGEEANLCVVGDDDQSIYRWRGADVRNILEFPNAFPGKTVGVVRLEQNYRSSANILRAASTLIAHNENRHDKTLRTDKPAGEPLRCYQADTEVGEARWVVKRAMECRRAGTSMSEIAVFYRTHSQSRVFEDALRSEGLPYVVVGGLKFYERKEVKDILTYLRLVHNPADDVALLRVIDAPPRGIGDRTLERAREVGIATGLTLFDALEVYGNSSDGTRARKAIERFRAQILAVRKVSDTTLDALAVAQAVLKETGYQKWLNEDGSLEAETRKENLDELLLSIEEWKKRNADRSLTAFIDHVSLLTSLDADARDDALTLMTVHAAKGLEFDAVFVTGLEHDVFPHFNSADDPEALDEERRLAYVAITRGRQRVFLTWSRSRQRFGRTDMNPPSRFLREIASDVKQMEAESGGGGGASMGSRSGWVSGGGGASPWASRPGGASAGSSAAKSPFGGSALGASPFGAMPKPAPKPGSGGTTSSGTAWAGTTRTTAPTSAERDLDFEDSQLDDGAGVPIGRQVFHPRFGIGKVTAAEGTGPDAHLTVLFKTFGEKRVVAKYLNSVP